MPNEQNVTLVLYDKDTEGNHKDFAHVLGDFNNWELTNKEDCQMCSRRCRRMLVDNPEQPQPDKRICISILCRTKGGEVIRLADAYCEKILDRGMTMTSRHPLSDNKRYPKGGKGISFGIQDTTRQLCLECTRFQDATSQTTGHLRNAPARFHCRP